VILPALDVAFNLVTLAAAVCFVLWRGCGRAEARGVYLELLPLAPLAEIADAVLASYRGAGLVERVLDLLGAAAWTYLWWRDRDDDDDDRWRRRRRRLLARVIVHDGRLVVDSVGGRSA